MYFLVIIYFHFETRNFCSRIRDCSNQLLKEDCDPFFMCLIMPHHLPSFSDHDFFGPAPPLTFTLTSHPARAQLLRRRLVRRTRAVFAAHHGRRVHARGAARGAAVWASDGRRYRGGWSEMQRQSKQRNTSKLSCICHHTYNKRGAAP